MNGLAKHMKKDGQALRSIFDYLTEAYEDIKGHEFMEGTFTDRIEFFEYIKEGVCPVLINSSKTWKEEEPEEYAIHN